MHERKRLAKNAAIIVIVVSQAVILFARGANQLGPDLLADSEPLANEVPNPERRPIDQQSASPPYPHVGHRIRYEGLRDLDHDIGLDISIRSNPPCRSY